MLDNASENSIMVMSKAVTGLMVHRVKRFLSLLVAGPCAPGTVTGGQQTQGAFFVVKGE